MSSQANVVVRDKSEKTKITLRFANDGPYNLIEMVWLPLEHANYIRKMRPESVLKIRENYDLNIGSGLDEDYASQKSLHHFDKYGHLFGISCEYFSRVIVVSNISGVYPISSQRHAWGADEKPVAIIDAEDCSNVNYSIGTNESYSCMNDPEFLDKIHEEVRQFNSWLESHIAPEKLEKLLVKPTKKGFIAAHNDLVAEILIRGIDLPDR